MACTHTQELWDLAASARARLIPTACFLVADGGQAKQYEEAASFVAAKPMLGPTHLHIARGELRR
eukprot:8722627-Pyramimonas_sp.AAC.1